MTTPKPDSELVKYKFTSSEWLRIKHHGFLAAIKERLPDDLWHPNQLEGQIVHINDEPFLVAGAEVFMIGGVSPSNPYKHEFSLLVKEIEKGQS